MNPGAGGDLRRLAGALATEARAAAQRRLIVLAGEPEWARGSAVSMLDAAGFERRTVLWAGNTPPDGVTGCAADGLTAFLGTEAQALVVDAHAGLDPDGLGAGAGTVRGGGLVLLLTPALAAWPAYRDPEAARLAVDGHGVEAVGGRFLRWLARTLVADRWTVVVEQGGAWPAVEPLPAPADEAPVTDDPDCATADQAAAVAAVLRTATGHRRRPTVLTADRGRGKSAALGIAAGRFLRERGGLVVVTGPRRAAVEPVLAHAAQVLGVTPRRTEVRTADGACLRFLLPEEMAAIEKPALVLVDEAAALPAATLARLLHAHSRIVFATTVHGYEGSGRGFALRFQALLESESPRRQNVTLSEPIRWCRGDPVEAVIFRALVLDAELPALSASSVETTPRAERIDRDRLLTDDGLLRSLFGLLVHAHYRTRPLDLRNLLDGPNLTLYVLWQGDDLVGTALVAAEGGFCREISHAIWAGQRRPRGHLLPQSLASHVGLPDGARATGARVMRIAIHPHRQRQGLGRALLETVAEASRREGMDLVGASFGATPELLRFWEGAGYRALRLGVRRDAASGTHSAVVATPLGRDGDRLVQAARARMARDFPLQLSDPLRDVEPALVAPLLAGLQASQPDDADWLDAVGFARGQRAYEVSLAGLRNVALWALTRTDIAADLETAEQYALIGRVIQQRPWREAAGLASVAGRRGLVELLRRGVDRLVAAHAPAQCRDVIPGR